jgi:protein disulfide-isomerase
MRIALSALALVATLTYAAGPMPYDESRDAKADVRQALSDARKANVPVLLIFGANWCEDCRALDAALSKGRNAELVKSEYKVVKVDVGRFDRNTDLDTAYGHPTKKGIPAAVILSPQNEVLYASRLGELADARHMSETGIYDFFRKVTDDAKKKR